MLELNKDYGEAHFRAETHPLSKRYHVSTFMFFLYSVNIYFMHVVIVRMQRKVEQPLTFMNGPSFFVH